MDVFVVEVVFCAVVFILSFLIYYKLRETYKLTEYKGLHYFSSTFLFLGLAYFLRFLVSILLLYDQSELGSMSWDFRSVMVFSIAFMVYSSSASILYLIYSLAWKWNEIFRNEALLHSLAIIFAVVSIIHRPISIFSIQIALLAILSVVIVLNYRSYEGDRKTVVGKVYPLYILLFLFWIFNLLLPFRVISFDFRIGIYALSVAVLCIIGYKVLRKL
ncbi:MAG: hypothetical protein QXO16_09170 [Archaeoglobaceae archaeon]